MSAKGYTYYHQCDPRWGDEIYGNGAKKNRQAENGPKKFKQAACLLCCIAMILDENPVGLNNWMKQNKGFDSDNNVCWGAFSRKGLTFITKQCEKQNVIAQFNQQKRHVILKVKSSHYALMTGYYTQIIDGKTITKIKVLDPGYQNIKEYDLSQVISAAVYEKK